MQEYKMLIEQKKKLDDNIEKTRMKEGKEKIKQVIKEYKLPASYIASLAKRVESNPKIYG